MPYVGTTFAAPRSDVREQWLHDRGPAGPSWPWGGLSGPPALSLLSPCLLTFLLLPWIGSSGLRVTPARVPVGTACLQCLLGAVVCLCHPPAPSLCHPPAPSPGAGGLREVLQVLGRRLMPDVVLARGGVGDLRLF